MGADREAIRKALDDATLAERRLVGVRPEFIRALLADLDAAEDRVAALEAGLREAQAWLPHGDGKRPADRGAKCETAYEMFAMIDALLDGQATDAPSGGAGGAR